MSYGNSDIDPSIELVPISSKQAAPKRWRRSYSVLLISGAVVLGLASLAAVVFTVIRISQQRDFDVSVAVYRSPAAMREEAVRVLSAFDVRDNPTAGLSSAEKAERQSIEQLFGKIEQSTTANDLEGFHALVDYNRLVKRIQFTGYLVGWSNFEKRSLRSQIRKSTDLDPFLAKIQIAGIVTPPDDPDSRIVYAYCFDEDNTDEMEQRFWIARDGDGWRLYDWERLDLGLSETMEWANYIKLAHSKTMQFFELWGQRVTEADALINSGDLESAKEALRSAERLPMPTEFGDFSRVLTGYRWLATGEASEAERCFRAVADPAATPGAFHGLMICARDSDPEHALRNASEYEKAVGPNPTLLEIKATSLDRLGRKDEARTEWRKLLRLQPQNTEAFVELCLGLSEDPIDIFEQELERCEDPVAIVTEIAASVAYQDFARIGDLINYLRRKAPTSAGLHYVSGLQKHFQGHYEEAASLFQQAFENESDVQKRDLYFNHYLEVMASDGRVIEALQCAPDQKSAYEHLMYLYDEDLLGLTPSEYQQVLEHHLHDHPEDLYAIERRIRLALNDKRYDDVVHLARDLPKHTPAEQQDEYDDYARSSIENHLAASLYHLGNLRDALAVGERADRFAPLVDLAISKDSWDDVQWLLSNYKGNRAEDPSMPYAEGRIAAHQKRYGDAVMHFRASLATNSGEWWLVRRELINAYIDSGDWQQFFASSEQPAEDFEDLATRFISLKDWEALNSLISMHQASSPDDLQILQVKADAAWERNHYDDFALYAEELLASKDSDGLLQYTRKQIEDKLLVALLHMERFDRARERAKEISEYEFSIGRQAIVEAAAGRHMEAYKLANQAAIASNSAAQLYFHEYAGELFLESAFGGLHSDFPVELNYNINGSAVSVLLFDAQPQLELARVTAVLENAGAEVRNVKAMRPTDDQTIPAIVAHTDDARIWMSTGNGKFNAHWAVRDDNPRLQHILETANGWLAVGTACWSPQNRREADETARRICSRIVDAPPLAVCERGIEPWMGFIMYPAIAEVLAAQKENKLARLSELGAHLIEEAENRVAEGRAFRQALRIAASVFESTNGAELEVETHLCGQPPLEPVVINVNKVHYVYSGVEFEGKLTADSKLIPQLKAGLPVRLPEYQVKRLRLNGEELAARP